MTDHLKYEINHNVKNLETPMYFKCVAGSLN